ncbi:hypothetical protein [Actinoplanes regularis]|uniref:Uncharacterized protein n=1 Tax=Actinoplanes regularis TaxID=52697 RepID=A0A238ZVQ3_9ACTN|nr:hypothetical protein [Actinoplanes regularis]GIE90251.1 hypothetical protein Are01nite_67310 [Actinoplanes regularis]SNR86978.1 hypothetical protein SAMN06264365_106318 [Actinoplanes regularis]
MTTRRDFLVLAGAGLALGGCRETTRPAAPMRDVVLAETSRGLVRLTPRGERSHGPAAALSHDGTRLAVVQENVLSQIVAGTGVTERTTGITAGWLPRAVSLDGRACALGRTPAATVPDGRARTPLLVVVDGRSREYDLPGVIEPDAFTSDATGLFVLEWLPAAKPDHYRVRVLDLDSGKTHPLSTRAKVPVPGGAEETMRGDGRQAVLSGDRKLLLTLYTHQPGHQHTRDLLSGRPGNAHAFVHVLHLVERWAYCLDLPHPFGEGPARGHAIAVGPGGAAVVDSTSGLLAYLDLESLAVGRRERVPISLDAAAFLLLTVDRRTIAGAAGKITVLDRDSGAVTAVWPVPEPLLGLGLSGDGERLYTGSPGSVHWHDATTGALLGRSAVEGLTALRFVR